MAATHGRKPKPLVLHSINGNPSHLKLKDMQAKEPKPKPIAPQPPSFLSKEAKEEWKRLSKELEVLGLLTQVDKMAFAGLCQSWAEYKQYTEFLAKEGLAWSAISSKTGEVTLRTYPEVAAQREALAKVIRLCTEFGLTPSARGRILLPGQNEDDNPWDGLIN